jgi:hypothetical protein
MSDGDQELRDLIKQTLSRLQPLLAHPGLWKWVGRGFLASLPVIAGLLVTAVIMLWRFSVQLAVIGGLPQDVKELNGKVESATTTVAELKGASQGIEKEMTRLANESKSAADQLGALKDVPKQLNDVKELAVRAESQGRDTARSVTEQTKQIQSLKTAAQESAEAIERVKTESVAAIQRIDRPKQLVVRLRLPLRKKGNPVAPEGTTEFRFDFAELAKEIPLDADLALGVDSVKLSGPAEDVAKLDEVSLILRAEMAEGHALRILVWTSNPDEFTKLSDQLFADVELSKR